MTYFKTFIAVTAALLGSTVVAGETEGDFIAISYTAYIGMNDLTNSNGTPLPNAAAVIQQDRANVHKFGLGTENDEVDSFFDKPEVRAKIPELITAAGGIDADLEALIMQGNVQVYVNVFADPHQTVADPPDWTTFFSNMVVFTLD